MEKPEEKVMEARKRKIAIGELQQPSPPVPLKTRRLDVVTPDNSASLVSSGNSTCVLTSCCSSETAKRSSKLIADLERENGSIVEFSAISAGSSGGTRNRREETPSNDVEGDSGDLESTTRQSDSNSGSSSTSDKMPSEADIMEFFTAAEENLQKQFTDKYNYDIVKDKPVEGRYEWIQLQQKP